MSRIPLLYIHGMGGGGDSRIPSILKEYFPGLVVMTYSFNPDEAQVQLKGLIEELHPKVIVGESLGSVHSPPYLARTSRGAGLSGAQCS